MGVASKFLCMLFCDIYHRTALEVILHSPLESGPTIRQHCKLPVEVLNVRPDTCMPNYASIHSYRKSIVCVCVCVKLIMGCLGLINCVFVFNGVVEHKLELIIAVKHDLSVPCMVYMYIMYISIQSHDLTKFNSEDIMSTSEQACRLCCIITCACNVALVPEEFTANMIQDKFNHNGFVVNHTCAGTYYSSYSQQMIRANCTVVDLISNNRSVPSPLTSSISISLLDFSKNPPLNTRMCNLINKSICVTYPASWLLNSYVHHVP